LATTHRLEVRVHDPHARELARITAERGISDISLIAEGESPLPITSGLGGIPLQEPGRYTVEVVLDGDPLIAPLPVVASVMVPGQPQPETSSTAPNPRGCLVERLRSAPSTRSSRGRHNQHSRGATSRAIHEPATGWTSISASAWI